MSISRRFYLDKTKNLTTISTTLTLTPSLSNFGQTVTWTVSSNLISKTLRFEILGANVEHFGNAALSGTLVTNGAGTGTLVRNLDKFYEYNSNTNVSVQVKIFSLANTQLATSTSNVLIRQANTFTATGGNISTFTGGVDNVHKFDTIGLANLTVTNVGTYSGANIDVVVIGGGGNGESGFWTNSPSGLTNAQLTAKELGSFTANSGAGGEGGRVTSTTITNNGFSLANYTIGVGNSTLSSHFNTPFSNITAAGGRSGQISGSGGADGIRTYGNATLTWRETSGGGGHGSAGLGTGGSITTGFFGPANNTGGNGGNGGAGTRITITGSEFYAGGGGGGGTWNPISGAPGGLGGGGAGGSRLVFSTGGTDGLGGGGGGAGPRFYGWFTGAIFKTAINYYTNPLDGVSYSGAFGGSGAVYIRYLRKYREMIIV